jgi:hypothetical protein
MIDFYAYICLLPTLLVKESFFGAVTSDGGNLYTMLSIFMD